MTNLIVKKNTYETLKKDGYTDKQIKALAAMATFQDSLPHKGDVDAYSCRPFPSKAYCMCIILKDRYSDDWFNSEVRYEYKNKASLMQTLSHVRQKAFKDSCPYLRYTDNTGERIWYMDYAMFHNDIPYSKELYVELD